MNINKKNINKKIVIVSAAVLLLTAYFSILHHVQAESISSISDTDKNDSDSECAAFAQDSDERDKCEELQKRADVYREIIDIKKKQGETLNNQLSIADSNIEQVQAQIEVSKQKIDDFNSQITRIEAQIREKKELIETQKGILAKIVQSYYEVNSTSPIISYLNDGNIASFIVKKDRIAQTGDKIKEMVNSVKGVRDDLENKKKQLDEKKSEYVLTNEKLESQSNNLEAVKKQKANLLVQTQGEEARYTQLLQRVEQQKQELLDIDQFFAASGLSVDTYPKPGSKYFASTDWFYSQRDPRWGNETIGNTKTLIKSYGCAVTAVAMVFKQHGGSVNPGQLSSEPIFSGDLINWPATWATPVLALTSSGKSHGNINWSIVDAQIAKGNPVIVYIGKTAGSGGHYVVIHHKESSTGKYVVHDPYFGPNIYLDTTRALVGAMGTQSSTTINQMIIYN
jgi:peptidoglycan hydrolase CwlO-like protein